MPRVRWCSIFLSILCIFSFWITAISADCWYNNQIYKESAEVLTAEPCLNCTCSRGTLLCYLRICPRLPNPPPPGCILLHKYKTCCPELICSEIFYGGNGLEARSEPDDLNLEFDKSTLDNACVANGTIYGPGSAMDSSSLCEYCYCLGGKQTCVKPKCLLPIQGCTPMYDKTNCCPIHYNCTNEFMLSSSTTTEKPSSLMGGCLVDGVYYKEGGKVLGVGHSVCDNCYCLRGVLRCEPLSCAPPLLGCLPVIKPGECCAASYNCNGTIQIQPEPNYGQYPIVSKEYAKLRKEVQVMKSNNQNNNKAHTTTDNSNVPFYVIAETSDTTLKQRNPGIYATTRQFTGMSFKPSTNKPFYYDSMVQENDSINQNKHSTRSYSQNKYGGVYYTTKNYDSQNNAKRGVSSSNSTSNTKLNNSENTTLKVLNALTTTKYKEQNKLRSSDYLGFNDDTLLSIVDSLLDVRLNRRVESTNSTEKDILTTTTDFETPTTTFSPTMNDDLTTIEITTSEYTTTEIEDPTTTISPLPITLKTVLNSTDCTESDTLERRQDDTDNSTTVIPIDINEINKLEEIKNFDETTITSSETSSTEETTEIISKQSGATLRSIPKVPIEIEVILNRTKNKENDYEYDYNESSLPPSLPNLRIIPFVAADALDSEKQKHNIVYHSQDRVADSFGYTNFFSPPIETQGGFIPKEPPILESFYENAVTAPSASSDLKLPEAGCIVDEREVGHGEPVASKSSCMACNCFYGNVVCQKAPCPNPRPGCRKSSVQDLSLCCPHYVCDEEEAPTVVLDRLEGTSSQEAVTVATGINTPDPFRDVIRTEPPPDLQSLIVDMMPYLARKTSPMPPSTTENPTLQTTEITTKVTEDFSLDKVLQFLFSKQSTETIETTTKASEIVTNNSQSKTHKPVSPNTNRRDDLNLINVDSSIPGMGILKLAGCNIYGRMYRVGRIISELSNPCLECKCTEIGVQCRALKC